MLLTGKLLVKKLFVGKLSVGKIVLAMLLLAGTSAAGSNPFPRYPGIETNVAFWEKIYGHYSVTQAVIHDRLDLAKVYEVVQLLDGEHADIRRHNSRVQTEAMEKYRKILSKLAHQEAETPEEIRVATLFPGPHGRLEMAAAADTVRSQLGLRERFRRGVVTSGAYMPEIKRIFAAHQLPGELVYIPHVESSFDLKAHSRLGAAGIWQFTRATGMKYLTINEVVDERLDPYLASDAAAKYLRKSYQALQSWPLAITSYNYGLAGTLRATRLEGGYEQIFSNYRQGHFKFAARNFYPEFLAALNVARKLERELAGSLERPQELRHFTLPGYAEVDVICRYFSVSRETLRTHNPALRQAVYSGEKLVPRGFRLQLPGSSLTPALAASFPMRLVEPAQRPTLFHRVQAGETAGTIARRYGVSLQSLIRANNLDQHATVYLRQNLRIPKKAAGKGAAAGSFLVDDRSAAVSTLSRQKEKAKPSPPVLSDLKKRRPVERVDIAPPPRDPAVYAVTDRHDREGAAYGTIVVQPEESLALYADWLGISSEELRRLNHLKKGDGAGPGVLPGQKLLLPFTATPPELFEGLRLNYLRETEDTFFAAYSVVGRKLYRVNAGDTIWDLCRNKFQIPLWLLGRYNATTNLSQLYAEQELIIPIIQPI